MGLLDDLRSWAFSSSEDVSPDEMLKALKEKGVGDGTAKGLAQPTDEPPRGLFHDPYAVHDWGGWRQRPSAITYETLREMARSNTVIAAIIQTRVNQVSQFCRPQQGPYDKGYRVILRDRRGKQSMSKAQEKRAGEIERMLETTGFLLPDERPSDRDTFRTFAKKSVRDILTYDQWAFELIRDRAGRVSRFIALPAASIRPAVADTEHMTPKERRDRVAYVQIYESSVIAEFGFDDLAWCVMNPRSDLLVNGFGYSPVEQIIRLVTSWLFGFDYNTRMFTQGSAIKGLINIKGAVPERQMRAFRRQWYSMITGVQNAWKTPILNADDVQWLSMHTANREMEYGAWMDWLTKLICAIYGVDPIEINFQFGNTGQSSSLGNQNNEEKITESKDKGLRPLIDHLVDHINQHIVWDLDEDFEFSFVGLDSKTEQSERDARLQEVAKVKMVDEIREEMGLEALPDDLGQVILDPQWLQYAQGKAAEAEGLLPDGTDPDAPQGGDDPFGWGDDFEGADEGDDEDGGDPPKGKEPPKKPADKPPGEAQKSALQAAAALEGLSVETLRKAQGVLQQMMEKSQ